MFILTEKPSVARDIANGLGGFKSENGYFVRNNADCIVSAAGHLLELQAPGDYEPRWNGSWTLESLPIIPASFKYSPIPSNIKTLKKIESCFKKFDSSEFYLATDAEREGELIGALILNHVGFKKYASAKRFWVSEALTPEVVRKGIAEAKPLSFYESYKNAGMARQHADWLVGMNMTRLLSVQANTLLSFGRVQTAILGAIYLRDKNIANFVPVPFFQLTASVVKDSKKVTFYLQNKSAQICANSDTDRFNNRNILEELFPKIQNNEITITEIDSQKKTENPPQLFNITGLQKYCSATYKMTPARVLEIAQRLYEEMHCLSYPRTPSVVLGDDNVDLFRKKFELLSEKYPDAASGCNTSYISSENKKLFNSAKLQDHHALIPLAPLPDVASDEERNVYNAVLQRFFGIIKEPYIYNEITVSAAINELQFSGKGRCILQEGFKLAQFCANNSTEDESESEEKVELFPEFITGEKLPVKDVNILSKQTSPKKHFTNSSILALMENPRDEEYSGKLAGIGTPATRAAIIEILLKRQYIKSKGQQLLIDDKGKFLIENIIKIPVLADFISIKTTTAWEEKLQDNPQDFYDGIKIFIQEQIPKIRINAKWESPNLGICPICGKGKIYEGKKSFFCSEYKNGCKMSIFKEISGTRISFTDAVSLLSGKATRVKKMKSKAGKEFQAALKRNGTKIEFVFQKKK